MSASVLPMRERRACTECGEPHVGAYPRCIRCFRAQRVGDNHVATAHEAVSLDDLVGELPRGWR